MSIVDAATNSFATAMAHASGSREPSESEIKVSLARAVGEQSSAEFFSRFANLVAHFDSDELRRSLHSYTRLHGLRLIQENSSDLSSGPTMPEFLKILAIAFLDLYDRKATIPVTPLNGAAKEDLDELQVLAGRTPPPPPEASPEEKLMAQVVTDWALLLGDAIREKMRTDRKYRDMVNRLADEGQLK